MLRYGLLFLGMSVGLGLYAEIGQSIFEKLPENSLLRQQCIGGAEEPTQCQEFRDIFNSVISYSDADIQKEHSSSFFLDIKRRQCMMNVIFPRIFSLIRAQPGCDQKDLETMVSVGNIVNDEMNYLDTVLQKQRIGWVPFDSYEISYQEDKPIRDLYDIVHAMQHMESMDLCEVVTTRYLLTKNKDKYEDPRFKQIGEECIVKCTQFIDEKTAAMNILQYAVFCIWISHHTKPFGF